MSYVIFNKRFITNIYIILIIKKNIIKKLKLIKIKLNEKNVLKILNLRENKKSLCKISGDKGLLILEIIL